MNARKIAAMHQVYGKVHGQTCKECPHFRRDRYHNKCEGYGISASVATDWSPHWSACFLIFDEELSFDHVPLFERLERKNGNEPIKGQISMFEEVNE